MNLEIHKPELVQRVNAHIQAGSAPVCRGLREETRSENTLMFPASGVRKETGRRHTLRPTQRLFPPVSLCSKVSQCEAGNHLCRASSSTINLANPIGAPFAPG